MHPIPEVTETLLKKLSKETQLVGQAVSLQSNDSAAGTPVLILNVIILPRAVFYREQFMHYYRQYHQNAVKALKELAGRYPDTEAYDLDLAYVLGTEAQATVLSENHLIRLREDFTLVQDNSLA